VFLSHIAKVKKEAAQMKEQLALFGVSAFVAHADIKPTQRWQDEIKRALVSMDAFVALFTATFHKSYWTDQEVGFALARGVPLIAMKLGCDPYGFIAKYQALACGWEGAPLELVKLLIKHPRMLDAYINAVPECSSFDQGNKLAEVLPCIEALTREQAERLVSAFNKNNQLQGSYEFNGTKEWKFGPGLAAHLTRLTGKKHKMIQSARPWPNSLQIKRKK
jgi:hypothetical protein